MRLPDLRSGKTKLAGSHRRDDPARPKRNTDAEHGAEDPHPHITAECGADGSASRPRLDVWANAVFQIQVESDETKAGSAPVNSQLRLTLSRQPKLAHLVLSLAALQNPESARGKPAKNAEGRLLSPECARDWTDTPAKLSGPVRTFPTPNAFDACLGFLRSLLLRY